MSKRNVLCAIFSLSLILSFCRSETAETAATDTAKTHYGGGCVMLSRATSAPVDLYMNTGVVQTDGYPPFTKKITVYGYTLVASWVPCFQLLLTQYPLSAKSANHFCSTFQTYGQTGTLKILKINSRIQAPSI